MFRFTSRFPLKIVTFLTLLGLVACTTHGHQRIEKTTDSMRATRTELLIGRNEIGTTLGTLKTISTKQQGDLVPLYKQFLKNISNVESQARTAQRRADQITRSSNSYLQAWGDEIATMQNPKIKARSAQRKTEVRKDFQSVSKSLHGLSGAYRPFISDVNDIQVSLNHALNPRGIASVTDIIQNAKRDGHEVIRRIDLAIREIDRVNRELSPNASMKR